MPKVHPDDIKGGQKVGQKGQRKLGREVEKIV